jgi:RNA polymerase sigma-70 factor (ECF subfamily)
VVLLTKVSAKDREAFSTLYKATCSKLYGVAIRILRRQHLAEDVLQDVYIKIWERAGDFDASRGSPITWMATIARNSALNEARRPSLISAEDISDIEEIADKNPLASEQMESSDEYRRMKKCLSGIEEEKRKMVMLAYHHGISRELLAKQFGHPVATIKTWLRRSLASLKECLES